MSAWGMMAPAAPAEPEPAPVADAEVDDDFPAIGAVVMKTKTGNVEDEYSLGSTGGGKKGGKKSKKEGKKVISLHDFNATAGGPQPMFGGPTVLPSGPRVREEGEDEFEYAGGQRLGGAFTRGDGQGQGRYGGDRGDRAFGGGDREERGPRRGEEEDLGPSRADEDKDWGKSKKFVPSADGPRRGGPGMMGGRGDGPPGREEREPLGPSRADEDRDWGKSKKFVPSDPREARPLPPPRVADEDRDWKARAPPPPMADDDRYRAREPEPDRSDWKKKETTPAGAPDRPRLKLAARTVPVESADSPANGSSAEDSAASKVNPFGGARPVAVKEVEDKPEAKPEAKEERKQREAPVGPRPSDADSWGKKEAPASRDVAPKGSNGGGAEGRGPPKLALAKRTVPVSESAAAGGAGGNSLFGGARPRELALEEKGRDWRKEEVELGRKGVRRAQTEEEKKLAAEVAAAREKVEAGGGGPEAAAALKAKEAELSALCLQLDDKVRFSTKGKEEKGGAAAGGAKGGDGKGKAERDWTAKSGAGGDAGGGFKEKKGFFKKDGDRPALKPKSGSPAVEKKAEVVKASDPDGWEEAKPSRRGKPATLGAAPAVEVKVGGGAFDGLTDE